MANKFVHNYYRKTNEETEQPILHANPFTLFLILILLLLGTGSPEVKAKIKKLFGF